MYSYVTRMYPYVTRMSPVWCISHDPADQNQSCESLSPNGAVHLSSIIIQSIHVGGDERGFCVIRDQAVLISVICESVKL